MKRLLFALGILLSISWAGNAERINQEGRILGNLLPVTNSILFDTSNTDAVVASMQIFPVTNPWNEDVSRLPILTNSTQMMAQIGADLLSSRQKLYLFQEMNYVLVPNGEPLLPIDFIYYPDQSDLNGGTYPSGLYPIPANLPIEGWPTQTGTQALAQWQTNNDGSDRHAIMVQPGTGALFETWSTALSAGSWQAGNGAIFDLNTNELRPAGWTSGDAAGLPMFSALVRYDECERGMVEHACRMVVKRTRYNSYIYPATHYASYATNTSPNLPAMGQRLRLKASYVIPSTWTKEEKALLLGLKKYGALVADNGNFFSISITPDDRWPANAFSDIVSPGIGLTNFEVVASTGPNEGPRSAGAPVAFAGTDQTIAVVGSAPLQGFVSYSGSAPVIAWKLYSGPGAATFDNAAQTNTMVNFSVPGIYTLELSAADGVHAMAYDAVVITVTNAIALVAHGGAGGVNLNWIGGNGPYIVEETGVLPAVVWTPVLTTGVQSVTFATTNKAGFFRVRGE